MSLKSCLPYRLGRRLMRDSWWGSTSPLLRSNSNTNDSRKRSIVVLVSGRRGVGTTTRMTSYGNKFEILEEDKENKEQERRRREAEVQFGESVDGIRTDFSEYLDNGITHPEVYAPDVKFQEPYHSGLNLQGKSLFLWLFKLMRTSLLWYYQDVTLTLTHFQLQHSQSHHPPFPDNEPPTPSSLEFTPTPSRTFPSPFILTTNTPSSDVASPKDFPKLYARFVLEGAPRPALLLSLPLAAPLPRKSYTGLFIYEFSLSGHVTSLKVAKIHPAPTIQAIFPRLAWWWWLRNAKPTPTPF